MTKRVQILLTSACAAAIAPWLVISPAQAQSSVEAIGADEIVVTARKRGEENVQNVPIAITAFGAAQLEALNVQDLQSLSYSMPNVQLEDVGTFAGYANFAIRGVGINSSIPSIDPAVGVFVDGVYMGISAGVVFDNFDMEGVEVLRGPQGVLFGRNVTGGAVLIRTTAPSDQFSFKGHAGVETGAAYVVDGVVTGPIAGALSGKLAVYYSDDEGWFDNDFNGAKHGAARQTIVRPAFRYAPSDTLEFILRLEHGEADGDGPASQNHALFSRDSFDFSIDEKGNYDNSWDQASLETNIDVGFGAGTITNIVGWRQYDSVGLSDIDATSGFGFHARAFTEQEQISDELRYAGTFGAVDVTGGLYYFQQDLFYMENRMIAGGAINATGGGDGDFSAWGAFLAADWRINPSFTLNFGLRYTEEEKSADVAVYGVDPGRANYEARNLVVNFVDSDTWNDTSPRVGFQWTPSSDTQIYGYWAKGFRAGGYNFRQTAPLTATVRPGPFDPENVTTYELGWKQDFADGRARINMAAFHNEVEDMQRELNTPGSFGVNQLILNAGDATIQGVEFEGRFFFTDTLLATLQAGYTHGEYDSVLINLDNNPPNDPNATPDAADLGLEIPRLAPWTYGASLVHDWTLGQWGVLTSRISYNHRDKNYYNDTNQGFFEASDIFDANFTLNPNDSNWSLSLYGTNLTDETTYGGDTILPDSGLFGGDGPAGPRPLPTFSPLNKGRVIGAEVRFKY